MYSYIHHFMPHIPQNPTIFFGNGINATILALNLAKSPASYPYTPSAIYNLIYKYYEMYNCFFGKI